MAGTPWREDVKRYLAALKGFEGVTGLTDMGADNDALRQLFVLSVDKKKIRHLQMVMPHRRFESMSPGAAWREGALLPLVPNAAQ